MWIYKSPEKSIWVLEKSWKFVSEKGYTTLYMNIGVKELWEKIKYLCVMKNQIRLVTFGEINVQSIDPEREILKQKIFWLKSTLPTSLKTYRIPPWIMGSWVKVTMESCENISKAYEQVNESRTSDSEWRTRKPSRRRTIWVFRASRLGTRTILWQHSPLGRFWRQERVTKRRAKNRSMFSFRDLLSVWKCTSNR